MSGVVAHRGDDQTEVNLAMQRGRARIPAFALSRGYTCTHLRLGRGH
jgi:hypothetical protein